MKIRKHLWLFTPLFCFIFVFSFFFSTILAKADDNINELTVGVPVDRCPIFYLDNDSGQVTGIGVDLMKVAADNSGYKLSFTPIKEKTIKEALDNESYDIIVPFGSAIKSEMGKSIVVSDNLFETPFTLVVTDNLKIPQLNTIHVGMLKSLVGAGDTVKSLYPGMRISFYDTMDESIRAVRNGEVDALLHNSYVWSYVLQKPSYSDLKVLSNAMFSMDFKAGALDTAKGREIIEHLNDGISKITDTKRQAIILDYTSRNLYQYDFSDYIYKYGVYILLIALLILALIIIAVMKNRSIKLQHEKKLQRLVDHDSLTGIYSLVGFKKRAEEILKEKPDDSYLLIYTNIKNFKYINEKFGKASGDELLCFLANRIKECAMDDEVVGRINADRFVILYHNSARGKVEYEYEKVFGPINNYFIDRGIDERVLLCYGIYVLTPLDYKQINIDLMIDYAHLAEKKVRESQNEGYEFYNKNQWERGKQVAEVINQIPIAIENGGIHVWYQPQYNYETGEITGAEALVRWKHEDKGFISPAYFIPILEETGLIYDLDLFVWERVCQDLSRWNELGYHKHVSVNLSRCDIKDDNDISEIFDNLIKKYNLSPDQLRIEITESAYVENPNVQLEVTDKLRMLGFQVEMDDFGSGYSSLNMLKNVTVDRIKLDLNFLTSSGDQKKSRIIISSIIKMLISLNVNMIAEGVETKEQADFLLSEGCSQMQGYYFYKPMPVEDFSKLILNNKK